MISLFFSGMLALYAFALVVFDNELFLPFLYLINVVMVGAYGLYALIVRVKPKFPAPFIAYTVLVALSVASIFWSVDQNFSIGMVRTMALILVSMFVVYNIIIHFGNATAFFIGLYAAIGFNLLMALGLVNLNLSEVGIRFLGSINQSNLMGYIGHVTVFFGYVHIVSVAGRRSVAAKKMVEILALLAICVVAVFVTYLTGSRTAIVLVAALLLWVFLTAFFKPVIAVPLIGVVVAAYLVVSSGSLGKLVISGDVDFANVAEMVYNRMESGAENDDGSVDERADLARAAYALYSERPLLGNGIGAFQSLNVSYAHNNYLEIMSSVGMIGLICMLSFYGLILRAILSMRVWRFKLLFGLMLLSFMAYDMALVSFNAKFQMLTPAVMLACITILRQNGERSLFNNPDFQVENQQRRRRRKRRSIGLSV
ncbi:O-antigen ligase family protein [Granulosicoccus antarcticus]|uniref:O-antigen ligase-related domain-containing protein n=1 Tax=Granulosicoccus antarcticus IMCC3135 TaxID=1192854 RepID=A0A2Z2NXN6_9GAMM|nr:O-antigen ligase family protein [Granulosicoccus antarcticus]ASJ74508.1 hypothetical protein IMCC3135_22185 [Granulosicoccus antarcticus IMCC3135]